MNRTGYCDTTLMLYLKWPKSYASILTPYNKICPSDGLYSFNNSWRRVDFPHPDGPTKATFCPAWILRFNPLYTFPTLKGY